MRRRLLSVPAVVVLLGGSLGACSSSWSSSCKTDLGKRQCEISVTGTDFHDMPIPFSGPDKSVKDKFRLVSATSGGEAVFNGGGTDGGNRCRQGDTITVGESQVTCTEVGDDALKFTMIRS